MLQEFLSQNGYGGIGNVALGAVHSIVIVVADSHRCGGMGPNRTRRDYEPHANPMRTVTFFRVGNSFLEMKF